MGDWRRQLEHYELNPNKKVLVRFEYAQSDATMLDPSTRRLFENWNSTKWNENILSTDNTAFLKELVIEDYLKYYPDWDRL